MARVAEATCATCSRIMPRNEMREVAVNRRVGSRFGISHSRRNLRESASVQYRRTMVWVCRGCPAPRSDGLIPWKTLLVLAAAAVAFLWFADAGTKKAIGSGVSTAIDSAQPFVNPAEKGPGAVEAAMGTNEIPAGRDEDRSADESEGLLSGLLGGTKTASKAGQPTGDAVDWSGEAIRQATIEALQRGKGSKWRDGDARGRIAVSEATTGDGGECRNVYATAKAEGDDLVSPTTTWCRPDGGEWTPNP